MKSSTEDSKGIRLNYYVSYTRHPLSLNLWEAEAYFSAIFVQQLIGNLVFYSNYGRYELRLAEHWERTKENIWKFKLRSNLFAENGEAITAASYKKSLERSIAIMANKSGVPVFELLVGYREFVAKSKDKIISDLPSLAGIVANGDYLEFVFEKPVKSGLLQILSFAPFGYIAEENLNADGTWRDATKFVSSGAYRVSYFSPGVVIELVRRKEFKTTSAGNIERVSFFQGIPKAVDVSTATIVDSSTPLSGSYVGLERFELYPEYLMAALLGNLEKGFFSKIENRMAFKEKFYSELDRLKNEDVDFIYSKEMFPGMKSLAKEQGHSSETRIVRPRVNPTESLFIRGTEPQIGARNWELWQVLKATLNSMDLPYIFSNSPNTREDLTRKDYDIRMAFPSVGGQIDPWLINVLFCSKLNSLMPDPSGRICNLVVEFEQSSIELDDYRKKFALAVEEDSAILAFGNYGMKLYLSSQIDRKTLSPLMSIVRFDQVRLSHD